MTGDIEVIRGAWTNLVDLTSYMSYGCHIDEDDTHTLDSVARMCRRFLEEYELYQQPQNQARKSKYVSR